MGGTGIQGRASLGGNLCNASPAGDTIPPMIVLSGEAEIAGPNGTRKVAVEDFCTAPGRTVLEDGEFLVSLNFPAPLANSGAFYRRFIPRNEMDIAVVGVGASVVLSGDRSSFVSARIAVGAVAPTPLYVREAGEALAGQPVSDETIRRAADLARDAARPISDMRGTAEYRKHLTSVLTRAGCGRRGPKSQGVAVDVEKSTRTDHHKRRSRRFSLRTAQQPARGAPRRPGSHRRQGRMQQRQLRGVQRDHGRQAGQLMLRSWASKPTDARSRP